jgi:hypothetical protein
MRADVEAWGWMTDCFSWIEPTCYSMLALRAAPANRWGDALREKRIAEGKEIILARRCPDGGWNYGNGQTQGYALRAFPVPTALVIATLHGLADERVLATAWKRLETLQAAESSLMSLSWGTIAGKALGKDVGSWLEQLPAHLESWPPRTNYEWAMALLATANPLPMFA